MNTVLTTERIHIPPRVVPGVLTSPTGWKQYMLQPTPHIVGSIPCPYCKEDTEFPADIRYGSPVTLGIKEIITCKFCKRLSFVMSRLHVWIMSHHLEWAYVQPAYSLCLFTISRKGIGQALEDALFGLSFAEWKMTTVLPRKYHRTEKP